MVMTATRMTTPRLPKVRAVRIPVTTTGSAGSATGTATSPIICGQILGVAVNWHASAPNTSDITVEGATSGIDLYAKANAVTDVYKCPSLYGLGAGGSALSGDVTPQRYCINEGVKVTVAQSDALTNCAVVTILYRPLFAEQITVNTTGSAGAASGTGYSASIRGEILGLNIDYHASAPGTTDIVVEMRTSGIDLYAKANTVTDAFVVPVLSGVDAANTALTSDVTPQHYFIADAVAVTLAQSDALTAAVVVTVFYAPLDAVRIAVTTTGAAGSAAGTVTVPAEGEIVAIVANFDAAAPGTTDIVVEDAESGIDFWARSDSAADAHVAPRLFGVTNADGALSSNVTPECYTVHGGITVTLAQCDAITNAVLVDVFIRK